MDGAWPAVERDYAHERFGRRGTWNLQLTTDDARTGEKMGREPHRRYDVLSRVDSL